MLLAASIAALVIGPLLFQISRVGSRTLGFLEGFTFITIAGLLGFSILPQAIGAGGLSAWAFVTLGLIFPIGLERAFHHLARQVHFLILLVGVAGLVVHAAIDGVALAMASAPGADDIDGWMHLGRRNDGDSLAFAVILHRFPLGLAVWYLLAPAVGTRPALTVLGLLTAGTFFGYLMGPGLMAAAQGTGIAWFQAFVAGSILHVIIYEPGHHKHLASDDSRSLEKWPDRIGLICGLVLLYVYL
jgi:zinc transporter ZupT